MDDSSKTFLRSLAAVVFVVVLGVVLVRPIFISNDEARDEGTRPEKTSEEEEQAAPVESPSPNRSKASVPTSPLIYGDYPKPCLKRAPSPPGEGAVAAFRHGEPGSSNEIAIASPGGVQLGSWPGSAPLQWSPSGRWLASRGLELREASGRPVRLPGLARGTEPWAWSPISDCLVVADGDRLVVIRPPNKTTVLVEGYADRFSFTPEGGMLVTSDGAIDLSVNPVRPIPAVSVSPNSCDISGRLKQEACAPDGRLVAAIRADRLVLTDIEGSFERPLTNDSGWSDAFPEWGPRGTGVLFVRIPVDDGAPEVWFVAEGGNPRPTGLTLPDRAGIANDDWLTYLDWSATPPGGAMPPILDE